MLRAYGSIMLTLSVKSMNSSGTLYRPINSPLFYTRNLPKIPFLTCGNEGGLVTTSTNNPPPVDQPLEVLPIRHSHRYKPSPPGRSRFGETPKGFDGPDSGPSPSLAVWIVVYRHFSWRFRAVCNRPGIISTTRWWAEASHAVGRGNQSL